MLFADKYKTFDAEGLPTHDTAGKAVSESIRNKLKKEQNKQNEVHQKWLAEQSSAAKSEEAKRE